MPSDFSNFLPVLPSSSLFARVKAPAPARQDLAVLHLCVESLPMPCSPPRPALEKCEVFCCSDIFILAGLGIRLIPPAALSDPCLCFSSSAGAALVHQLGFHHQSLLSAPLSSKPLSSRPATRCSQRSFISSSLPVEVPFRSLWSASSASLFEQPLCGGGTLLLPLVWQRTPRRAPRRPTPCWQPPLRRCPASGKRLPSPAPLLLFLTFICLFCSGRRLLCVTSLTVP